MSYCLPVSDPTDLISWKALKAHRGALQGFSMSEVFAKDPNRFEQFSHSACGLFLDYSKNLITEETQSLLVALAQEAGVPQAIKAMFAGQAINTSEQRPALHIALRQPPHEAPVVQGEALGPKVQAALAQMERIVQQLQQRDWRGYKGDPITDVVNIGIGGSFLGPQVVTEALQPYAHTSGIRCHYLANIDSSEFHQITRCLKAESTLFIVSSKTFTTLETLKNAQAARQWFLDQGGSEACIHRHFIAVTSNIPAAVAFGIPEHQVLPMWDWVGGRYSLWSAIGLPIAIALGMDQFKALLHGAHAMDQHFREAPLEANLPVLMGLLGVWYHNFWDAQSYAFLPYDHYLRDFVKHLQQMDMESNGKTVRQDGKAVSYSTGPIVWGGVGTNGQHAYHQLLHQGTALIPVDFVVPVQSHNPVTDHQAWLYANCLSQSQALMCGKSRAEAEAELRAKGLDEAEVQRLAPHKVIPGNRPSNTLVMERLDPERLGALIALYEHKVFVQGVIWGINSFDQWGVELGKELGKDIYNQLTASTRPQAREASTQGLVDYFRQYA